MNRIRTLVTVPTLLLVGCSGATSGSEVAAVRVVRADGTTAPVSSYLDGRPLVVSLWSVWCQPCRQELPELSDIVADTAATVDVLALNIGDEPSRIDDYLTELGVDLPVAIDTDGEALEALDAVSVPVTLILDADGSIRWRHVGAVSRSEIDEALSGL